ncbi:MAG: hypothetical protein ABI678_31360 [Kofleriaceae bacterium]
MPTNVGADIEVQRFGYVGDDQGNRLVFPHAQTHKVEGQSGSAQYGAAECTFENLEGQLGILRWEAGSASIGTAWLKSTTGRYSITADRVEMPHGLRLVRAAEIAAGSALELVSPHVSFSELRIDIDGPFGRSEAPPPMPASVSVTGPMPALSQRQEKLRFLDSLTGRIYLTMKVQLDLPVLGVRTLDQQLKVPIQEGSLDFRALEDSLDWLEGAFLDIDHDKNKLKVRWKVPIFGSSHDLITWQLDTEAATLAAFGRVPVRSLTEFRTGEAGPIKEKEKEKKEGKNGGVLKSFKVDGIDIALSLLAPRNLEVGQGLIAFGGEDQPGMVDFKVSGALDSNGPGRLRGAIGSIDTTIKDLRVGPAEITCDRLHFDGLDQLEVTFDGYEMTKISVVIHRVTATNLAIKIG